MFIFFTVWITFGILNATWFSFDVFCSPIRSEEEKEFLELIFSNGYYFSIIVFLLVLLGPILTLIWLYLPE